MEIPIELVKKLREKTQAGVMDCKNALMEAGGDFDKAVEILRKKGLMIARSKVGRTTKEGLIASYIHTGGRIGVLLEIMCETDFVARTPEFQELAKDIAMHIAAASPLYLNRESVPESVLAKEREILLAQLQDTKKPPEIIEKIVEGRMGKFYSEYCLLEQPFIKDLNITVGRHIQNAIAKLGENIVVRRFVRYLLGEEL